MFTWRVFRLGVNTNKINWSALMANLKMRDLITTTALIAACASLTACATASKRLGLTTTAPNEFNILTKAPLVVPPEYNLLPPRVGESSADNNYTQEAARKALIGDIDPTEPTRGEIVLMTKAGVGRANQEVRVEIDGANSVERKTKGFSDRVLFWQNGSVKMPDGTPLDAEIEAKRLESMKAATGGGEVKIMRKPGRAKLPGL